jgi:hypothetical protein
VILVYSSWSYWVFRGKARSDVGYDRTPSTTVVLALAAGAAMSAGAKSRSRDDRDGLPSPVWVNSVVFGEPARGPLYTQYLA